MFITHRAVGLLGRVVHEFDSDIAIMCHKPLVSWVSVCSKYNAAAVHKASADVHVDDTKELITLHVGLADISRHSVDRSLVNQLQESQWALEDLTDYLLVSELTSKNLFIEQIDVFNEQAGAASSGLIHLGTQLSGAALEYVFRSSYFRMRTDLHTCF